jgi:ABC-type branched-subunit amino acid transport system ATPase component
MHTDNAELACQDLFAYYGTLRVVHGVSFQLQEREVLAVLGPNGAGKSTLLGCISGQVRCTGSIATRAQRIDRVAAHHRARHGVALVPTGRGLFPEMTVKDNLALGSRLLPRTQRREATRLILETFPLLGRRLAQKAGSLSGGEQQMLAIAKALVARPRVLLLDEPTQGLAPAARNDLTQTLLHLRHKVSILLVEQNHAFAATLADRYLVLSGGRVTAAGDRAALADREAVMQAYTA